MKWKPSAVAVCSAAVILCGPAQATTFNFTDEYYVSTLAQFHTEFGSTTSGFSVAGIYQETNTATPTVTLLSAQSTGHYQGVPGEFVQNTTPNAIAAIVLTNWNHFFSTVPSVVNNGGASVTGPNNATGGTGNPSTSTPANSPSIQYFTGITGVNTSACSTGSCTGTSTFTGGTATAFNLNSIDFNTNGAAIGAEIEGLLHGVVEDTFKGSINNGSGWGTQTFNWTDIDTVLFVYPGSPAGALSMRNINVSVPGPVVGAGLPGLILACGGLIALGRRRRQKTA
jgi:hypothetical protein